MHACICGLSNGLGVHVAAQLSLLLILLSNNDENENENNENGKDNHTSSTSFGKGEEGCFVTKITLCDALVVGGDGANRKEANDDCAFVTEKDVALSGGILLASDIGDRKSIALCRRLRARVSSLSSSSSSATKEEKENEKNIIIDVAEDCFLFGELTMPPIDVMFFCDGAGPLSVACNANERLRKRGGGGGKEENGADHQRQQLKQRPIFVYCTVEHHGSGNSSSGGSSGGGGGDVGTIFIDDGSGCDVDEAEKSSGNDMTSKSLYDALRPQFTALLANALDEAGAGNVDEDEKRRRERRAALHWEFLKMTPEATPLLHAVSERSGDKNKDKFLSSTASATIVRERDFSARGSNGIGLSSGNSSSGGSAGTGPARHAVCTPSSAPRGSTRSAA